MNRSNRLKGILLVILSAVIYGATPCMSKYTYSHGSNAIMSTLLRSLLPIPIILCILAAKKISVKIPLKTFGKLAVIACFGSTFTSVMLNLSYNYIPVGMSTTLHFVYPTFVTVLCALFYREHITSSKVLALLISGGGILCFFQGGNTNLTGILLALGSGLTYAFFMVTVDKWGAKDMHPMVFSFYICIFVSVYTTIYAFLTDSFTLGLTPLSWIYTIIVAISVSVGANAFLQMGIKHTGASTSAILSMFEPITSVVCGVLFLRESLSVMKLLGCALILFAVYLLTKRGTVEE
ncbi:MAG: DMT family transporter [Oscillospiraceae bacterium]|nr:DMT family transporter [Oscillospiraceae bacterium]